VRRQKRYAVCLSKKIECWVGVGQREMAMKNIARSETEDEKWEKLTTTTVAQRIEGKSLVLLQVNCSSLYDKTSDFWNSVDTHCGCCKIVIKSWPRQEICKTKVSRADFTTVRRDQCAHGGAVFICIKNYIACDEVWVDKDFEMNAV